MLQANAMLIFEIGLSFRNLQANALLVFEIGLSFRTLQANALLVFQHVLSTAYISLMNLFDLILALRSDE
jgi:hypothetical protein